MKILLCGSIAYDSIMVFHGRFKEHILPDQVHILNVSFLVPTLRREFGGVAGNIAYNLALLGGHPLPMGTVGDDGTEYLVRFDSLGIDRSHVMSIPDTRTAQAFITTDLDDNQISAFHPGAMSHSHRNVLPPAAGLAVALVGPDGREGMLANARGLAERGVPFLFDPGQAMPLFSGEELLWFARHASFVAVNDYEARLLASKTGHSIEQLAAGVKALVVTLGAGGSRIHAQGRSWEIAAAPAERVVDPTGCGDAYRAGLLLGITRGFDWETCGRLASVMGAAKIECHGAQQHRLDSTQVAERFRAAYGYRPW